ncbi:MAG: HAD-IA family hydrolase, partial [Desulforhabdus sp.]|jgi:phosphoglycolate phosphatase|nr:HAD-IA family hydrolase [Desulforhabdus sp.]
MSRVNPEACGDFQKSAHALILDMELEAARRGRLFAFSRTILEELKRAGIQTAIITRNCEQAVRIVFPDLEDHCCGFLSRDHVPQVKPDPDHLLRALRLIAVEPGSALMVGDHPIDIQTGIRAGVMTAGVCSGNASHKDLVESGAHWTARDCCQLVMELKSLDLI